MNRTKKMNPYSYAGLPEYIKKHVKDNLRLKEPRKNQFQTLLENACELTHADKMDLLNGKRYGEVVKAKRLFCHYLRTYTNMPLKAIGQKIGVDHATVLHHFRTCNEYLELKDKEYMQLVADYKIVNSDMFIY